jgi:hypothetical protein
MEGRLGNRFSMSFINSDVLCCSNKSQARESSRGPWGTHHCVIDDFLLHEEMFQMSGVRFADVLVISIFVHARLPFGGDRDREQSL